MEWWRSTGSLSSTVRRGKEESPPALCILQRRLRQRALAATREEGLGGFASPLTPHASLIYLQENRYADPSICRLRRQGTLFGAQRRCHPPCQARRHRLVRGAVARQRRSAGDAA